ncbi:hypothetical protein ACJMK2_042397 [Sinanodonta woodiana]|uniref:Uncharacterized protein n=1 Tax=Sinanodonta woodiana TaxID=1069815 RepID=A0ABD3W8P6_SINWO
MASANSTGKEKALRRVIERFADKCAMQGIPYIHAATFWWSRLIWGASQGNVSNDYDYENYYEYGADGDQGQNSTSGYRGSHKEEGYVEEQRFKKNYMDLPSEDRKAAGHFMKDMIVSCSFAGRECTEKFFKLHQTADYGNCWEWNSTNKIATRSGEMADLSQMYFMNLLIRIDPRIKHAEFLETVSEGYGARLVIHEPGTIPLPSSEGIFISSSFETNIGLRMVQVSRLGEPYSKCNDGKTFKEQYGVTYTRQSCQFICITSTIIRICGCYDDNGEELAMMVNGTTRRCENGTGKACYREVFKDYRNKEISCDCLNPCNEYTYTRTISSRPWPTDEYAQSLVKAVCNKSTEMCTILQNNYTDNRSLNYNFLKLNVYFEDLNFEIIQETPQIAIAQFMSDVGGAIGLWIGLSVLAICEIFQLIIELCSLGITKCRSKDRTLQFSEGNVEQRINAAGKFQARKKNDEPANTQEEETIESLHIAQQHMDAEGYQTPKKTTRNMPHTKTITIQNRYEILTIEEEKEESIEDKVDETDQSGLQSLTSTPIPIKRKIKCKTISDSSPSDDNILPMLLVIPQTNKAEAKILKQDEGKRRK